ncbi:hypothetical protein PM10SUCC1_27100 [Propionigenium maris DSM 9537]|uniref:Endonuclease/exonuclease/phosphatase domain-containing protein n=1 Tax=Propionigenium maris DSM 9537 TaxID=1123000 RepID=A0A9W6LNC5_9FUSO|nr:endonuclease/exonuclease/phosphatase family protein [Propionigenium maris]GLI57196.1 hypothetical protein PM10SUCC1_27100 [Propionigenium maris DSM 9537]
MRLLTLNCHSWQEEDQIEKIRYLAETISQGGYDVVALQEVSQHKDSKIIYDNIREDNFAHLLVEELKKLGSNYSFIWDFSHYGYDVWEEGVALLSKHSIEDRESFYISHSNSIHNWKSRKIVGGSVEVEGESIAFYTCHTGWWSDEDEPFEHQGRELHKRLRDLDRRTFFMGDFNNDARVRGEGYDFLVQKKFIDTFTLAKSKDEGHTVLGDIAGWEGDHSHKRLDIIFTNRITDVKSSRVIFNGENKEIISDHFGVEVTLD